MLRKCFLVPVLGSLALLVFVVDVAQAQGLRGRRMERRDARRGYVYETDPLLATSMTTNQGMPMGMSPTVQTTTNARISFYPTANLNECCQIRVICPDAQCKVTFDGKATNLTGTTRVFDTPALTGTCTYMVRCAWMENGNLVERGIQLTCTPNQQCVVDFTAPGRVVLR